MSRSFYFCTFCNMTNMLSLNPFEFCKRLTWIRLFFFNDVHFWAVFTWFHLSNLNTYLLYLNQVKYEINPLLTLRYKIALYRSVVLIDLHFIFLWVNNRLWYRNLFTSDVSSLKIETNMVHTRHSKFYFFFIQNCHFSSGFQILL